jgi:hypothetical protein
MQSAAEQGRLPVSVIRANTLSTGHTQYTVPTPVKQVTGMHRPRTILHITLGRNTGRFADAAGSTSLHVALTQNVRRCPAG